MIKWILLRQITNIPVPPELSYFNPDRYSASQSTQLIKKGFNPKIALYRLDGAEKERYTTQMERLGPVYKEANADFWFSFESSKCVSTCPMPPAVCSDKKGNFIYSAGFRVEKNKKLGQGGFGSVYPGCIHGAEIAAKYIDVTSKYKGLFGQELLVPAKVIPAILGDVAYEASVQNGFGHKNILKSKEWWLQLSKGDLIELVISTPRCYCNLKEWLDKEPFKFDQIRRFLVETTEALEYLARQKLSHRDVKPSNILISETKDPTVKLTDFGLMKIDGVTPVFCAPEQLMKNGTVVGKTDVHGLGVSIMVSLFMENEAMKILFGIPKKNDQTVIDNALTDPVIVLVTSMIQYDPADRPTLTKVITQLEKLPQIESRKTVASLHLKLTADPKNARGNTLKLKFEGLPMVNITVTPSTQPHRSIISCSVHDQLESGLCWAFAFSSLIRGELKRLIRKLAAAGLINAAIEDETIRLTDKMNTENKLMNEIVCLVVPRNPKLKNVGKAEDQQAGKSAINKICYASLMRPAGWKQLPSVRRVTDKLIAKAAGRNIGMSC